MIKEMFLRKAVEVFIKIKDNGCIRDVIKKTQTHETTTYKLFKHFENLELIENRIIKKHTGGKKSWGRRERIFLTEKGKQVQVFLFELVELTK